MATSSSKNNVRDATEAVSGGDEKPSAQPLESKTVSPPPCGIVPDISAETSKNNEFIKNEAGLPSVPDQNNAVYEQNPVAHYYAPPSYPASPGFNNGYTSLQPMPNPPPEYSFNQPGNQSQIPPVYSAPFEGQAPVITQPTPSGPPSINFGSPPGTGQPVTFQPMPVGVPQVNFGASPPGPSEGWMVPPPLIPVDCPPGLEYLTTIDSLLVKQKVELLEAFVGFETNNMYTVRNSNGDKVFYVTEDNDCCTRCCFGYLRNFELRVLDKSGTEIIRISRDLRCDSCLFPCCLQELKVFAPPGNFVGSVVQKWAVCQPLFDIKDDAGNTVLKIEGPVCQCSMCGDVDFNVLSKNKEAVVGKISKKWSGLAREIFTDADNFGISFPLDLAVRMKAVMIGACFLIDFMYFEQADVGACALFASCLDCLSSCIQCFAIGGCDDGGSGGCCGDGCDCDCDGCCDCGDCGECDDCGGGGGDCGGGGGDCGDCGDCG